MAKGKISAKQEEILEYIKAQTLQRGYPPAVREICDAVHLKSTSSVHSHLETLEKNGYIRRDPTKPRAIEIIECSGDWRDCSRRTYFCRAEYRGIFSVTSRGCTDRRIIHVESAWREYDQCRNL